MRSEGYRTTRGSGPSCSRQDYFAIGIPVRPSTMIAGDMPAGTSDVSGAPGDAHDSLLCALRRHRKQTAKRGDHQVRTSIRPGLIRLRESKSPED